MNLRNAVELLTVAALWGASFLFMRVLAPDLGPVLTAAGRMLFGALFLGLTFLVWREPTQLFRRFPLLLLIGAVNSALPFTLYSAAALVVPASVEVVFNALSPAFGALAGTLFLGEGFGLSQALGMGLGLAGVVTVAGGLNLRADGALLAGLAACIAAPLCYAVAGVLVRRWAEGLSARALAYGSQVWAGLLLLPGAALTAPATPPAVETWLVLALFGLLCSGLAYVLYYALMKRLGPTRTLTVTYLMPVFGVLWGTVILHEPLTANLALGAALVLAGTALTQRSPRP